MKQKIIKNTHIKAHNVEGMATVSPEMFRFFRALEKAARTDASVLIRGETGTGKELAAKAIHKLSRRGEMGFSAINCASLTAEMMASELFGHVKGAYTGAVKDRKGLLRIAHMGSIFMDEIAEMPIELQARILRVLQERRFTPLGSNQEIDVDVRVISATHVALRKAVKEQKFRADLMFRLRVLPIYLPALRERTGDIEMLFWRFIDEFSAYEGDYRIDSIESNAWQAIMEYKWPGNIRELRNVAEYAVVMATSKTITSNELPPELFEEEEEEEEEFVEDQFPLNPQEEAHSIKNALRNTRGNRQAAADKLGMSRSTLWRKMREHHIQLGSINTNENK